MNELEGIGKIYKARSNLPVYGIASLDYSIITYEERHTQKIEKARSIAKIGQIVYRFMNLRNKRLF
ncbi:MAG: hypothetical protein ACLTS6_22260 [Anaerobutyricum sp.]